MKRGNSVTTSVCRFIVSLCSIWILSYETL